MKKLSLAILFSLLSAGGTALAQNAASGGITESTDPAKAAAVEQRAQELAAQQQSAAQQATGAASDTGAAKRHKRSGSKRMAKSNKNADTSSGGSDSGSSGSK